MTDNQSIESLERALRRIEQAVRTTIPRAVAKIAADHFVDNFRKGGFVNNGLQKWKDVKRRDPTSKWYGFEYRGDTRANDGKNKRLNYSPTATRRNILTSKRNYLMNSIRGGEIGGQVIISTDAPHAEIHNNGGTFKVFGKRTATMPKRQFIGESKELNDQVEQLIIKTIDDIFKKI